MTDTIYAVLAQMRTGSSMCMEALAKGGMDAIYSRGLDERRNKINPNGNDKYYELNHQARLELLPHTYQSGRLVFAYTESYLDSPVYREKFVEKYKGKLVKLVVPWLWALPKHINTRIVYMTRDPIEIRASYLAFCGRDLGEKFVDGYWQSTRSRIQTLKDQGHNIQEMNYADVRANPRKEFKKLCWPINAHRAASVVDLSKYRSRHVQRTG